MIYICTLPHSPEYGFIVAYDEVYSFVLNRQVHEQVGVVGVVAEQRGTEDDAQVVLVHLVLLVVSYPV